MRDSSDGHAVEHTPSQIKVIEEIKLEGETNFITVLKLTFAHEDGTALKTHGAAIVRPDSTVFNSAIELAGFSLVSTLSSSVINLYIDKTPLCESSLKST